VKSAVTYIQILIYYSYTFTYRSQKLCNRETSFCTNVEESIRIWIYVSADFRFGPRKMTSNFRVPIKWSQRSHIFKFFYITQLLYKRILIQSFCDQYGCVMSDGEGVMSHILRSMQSLSWPLKGNEIMQPYPWDHCAGPYQLESLRWPLKWIERIELAPKKNWNHCGGL